MHLVVRFNVGRDDWSIRHRAIVVEVAQANTAYYTVLDMFSRSNAEIPIIWLDVWPEIGLYSATPLAEGVIMRRRAGGVA
jgi:hypothetical protein